MNETENSTMKKDVRAAMTSVLERIDGYDKETMTREQMKELIADASLASMLMLAAVSLMQGEVKDKQESVKMSERFSRLGLSDATIDFLKESIENK
jgi:hypothetical protein